MRRAFPLLSSALFDWNNEGLAYEQRCREKFPAPHLATV
jgi:hypothetical protein